MEKKETLPVVIKILLRLKNPQTFKDLEALASRAQLYRLVPMLRENGLIKEIEKGEHLTKSKFVIFSYPSETDVEEAIEDFRKRLAEELSWSDLQNHPKVHRVLNDEARSHALLFASQKDPRITIGDKTRYARSPVKSCGLVTPPYEASPDVFCSSLKTPPKTE